ncbi:MAG: hypothetical protein ACREKE_05190, partial [bacterium]
MPLADFSPMSRGWDRTLVVFALLLCAFSLVLIVSATAADPTQHGLPLRQAMWILLGLLAMAFASSLDHHGLVNLGYLAYVV